jgi:hypothetical protein
MDITEAIAEKLDSVFSDIPIYTENIDFEEDDLKKASFFVQRVSMNVIPHLFDMQKRLYRYNIVYFPNQEDTRQDVDDMAERLAIEIQQINGIARMTERNFDITESNPPFLELHFSFALEVHVMLDKGVKFNDKLDYKGGLKDG